jgi:flagellar assembly protein FliH
MTLSSPEYRTDQPQVWEPAEFTAGAPAPRIEPAPDGRPASLFEVSPNAGIPDAVLAPARLAAESAGYVAGWNSGREAGQLALEAEAALLREAAEQEARAARAELDRAIQALRDAARALEQRTVPSADEVEELILATAFQVAEAIVGASLTDDELRGRAALRRALALAPRDLPVVVRLNPIDLAVLGDAAQTVDASVTLVADPTLAPGDAWATSAATRIDARIGAGIERVRKHLVRADVPR